jgi:diguanylate cyclase (GGDEF)-like protein
VTSGTLPDSARKGREEEEPESKAASVSVAPAGDDSDVEGPFDSWLERAVRRELDGDGLGLGSIYRLLEGLATRHGLTDAVVVVDDKTLSGLQMFRLHERPVTAALAERLGDGAGLYCNPDVVPPAEVASFVMYCRVALRYHLANFAAAHDPLTNLANRRVFDLSLDESAARSARYQWSFAVVLIDLDDFKEVNDHAGHDRGDVVLCQFALGLRRALRQGDTAARIGGDEFAVILSHAAGRDAVTFVDRLRETLVAEGCDVKFTAGWAASPDDSIDAEELRRIADRRLYERKERRR